MRRPAPLFLLPVLLVVAACAASPEWAGTSRTPAQRAADLAQCRAEAQEDLQPSEYTPPGANHSSEPIQPMTLVDQNDIRKHFERLVAACMIAKGYHRAH